MPLSIRAIVRGLCLGLLAATAVGTAARAESHGRHLDRVFIIVMENHGFDQVIGQVLEDASYNYVTPVTPFTTQLAQSSGLATYYFGATHPSLPNYIALIAGDYFGINSDTDSCYANSGGNCITGLNGPNIVDQLEQKHISWEVLQESMPSVGFLGARYPEAPGPKLYAQKHNPFVYFTSIATNPARLQNIKPFAIGEFQDQLNHPQSMPRYVFIAPNQCNDGHGSVGGDAQHPSPPKCDTDTNLLMTGDAFLQKTVTAIQNSPSFTDRSAIFIVWDENDFSGNLGCCGIAGGGHIASIIVTKHGRPAKSALPMTHYSLLATIEDGFGLPRLANAKTANAMWDLIRDADDDHGDRRVGD